MGLGLYICEQITKTNDGKLDFVSKKNVGSIFIFTFKVEPQQRDQNISQ